MTRIAFFDMDGTIIGTNAKNHESEQGTTFWGRLAAHLDCYGAKKELTEEFYEGDIESPLEWIESTIELYRDNGLTKDNFTAVGREMYYKDSAGVVLGHLSKCEDIRTVIITGGFKFQAEKIQRELGIDSTVAGCELFWSNDGKMEGYNVLPLSKHAKSDVLDMFAESEKVDLEDCSYVGDGENDSIALQRCGLGIAIHPQTAAKESSDVVIEDGSFRDVAEYLEAFHGLENLI